MSLERKELLVKLLISRRLSFSYQNPVRRIPGVSYPPPGPLAFNYTWVFFLSFSKVCFFSIFKVLGDLIHYLLFFFVVLHSPSPHCPFSSLHTEPWRSHSSQQGLLTMVFLLFNPLSLWLPVWITGSSSVAIYTTEGKDSPSAISVV